MRRTFISHVHVRSVAHLCSTLYSTDCIACQAPLSMGFSRQEGWSGLPFPTPGDLPNPGIKPTSPGRQTLFHRAPRGALTSPTRCQHVSPAPPGGGCSQLRWVRKRRTPAVAWHPSTQPASKSATPPSVFFPQCFLCLHRFAPGYLLDLTAPPHHASGGSVREGGKLVDQMQDLKSSEGRPCQPWSTRLALKTVGEAYLLRQPRSTPASPAGGQERAGGARLQHPPREAGRGPGACGSGLPATLPSCL